MFFNTAAMRYRRAAPSNRAERHQGRRFSKTERKSKGDKTSPCGTPRRIPGTKHRLDADRSSKLTGAPPQVDEDPRRCRHGEPRSRHPKNVSKQSNNRARHNGSRRTLRVLAGGGKRKRGRANRHAEARQEREPTWKARASRHRCHGNTSARLEGAQQRQARSTCPLSPTPNSRR